MMLPLPASTSPTPKASGQRNLYGRFSNSDVFAKATLRSVVEF